METDKLRVFRAVVEADSLTRGAKVVHRTPGAVSKAIAQLETELGHELFYREGRRLVLNDAGRALYASSGRVLEEVRQMRRTLDRTTDREGVTGVPPTLRLGTFEVFSTHLFGALLVEMRELWADRPLVLAEFGIGAIEDALRRRAIDVGITYVPYPHRDLNFDPVTQLRFRAYARRGCFRGEAFADIPFAVPLRILENAPTDLLGLDAWPDDRAPRRVHHRFALLESGLQATRLGHCAVVIPDAIAAAYNAKAKRADSLEALPHPSGVGTLRETVYLVTRNGEGREVGARDLAAGLRRVCGQGAR